MTLARPVGAWSTTTWSRGERHHASDFAVTAKGGDFTVHVVVGVDPDDNLYILDIWRKQATTDIWIDQMIGLMQKHRPTYLWVAPADQIKRSVGPFLTKRMAEAGTYVAIREMSEAGDKPTKARSFQGRMATGKAYFPKQAEWLDDLVMEMSMFPVGHDDQVDALGLIGRMLDEMVGGHGPAPGLEPDDPMMALKSTPKTTGRRSEDSEPSRPVRGGVVCLQAMVRRSRPTVHLACNVRSHGELA